MVYRITEGAIIGLQPIAETRLPLAITAIDGPNLSAELQAGLLGRRVRAFDDTYGEGEFIYLQGIASTIVGSLVIYDELTKLTKLAVSGAPGDRGPCAVAMSANIASQFGWYQIAGSAIVSAASAGAGSPVYSSAVAGQVASAVIATNQVIGAYFKTAINVPTTGFATVQLDRPSLSGTG